MAEAEPGRPTLTAIAARDFLARVDNKSYRQAIETRAILGGWVGARGAGLMGREGLRCGRDGRARCALGPVPGMGGRMRRPRTREGGH